VKQCVVELTLVINVEPWDKVVYAVTGLQILFLDEMLQGIMGRFAEVQKDDQTLLLGKQTVVTKKPILQIQK